MAENKYELIKSWAGVWTWHTTHPLDEKRFHQALYNVYQAVGSEINIVALKTAIEQSASKIEGTPQGVARSQAIDRYMEKASIIISFLKDIQVQC